jgi:hypothetical protein
VSSSRYALLSQLYLRRLRGDRCAARDLKRDLALEGAPGREDGLGCEDERDRDQSRSPYTQARAALGAPVTSLRQWEALAAARRKAVRNASAICTA